MLPSCYNIILATILSAHLIEICFSCNMDIIFRDSSHYKILYWRHGENIFESKQKALTRRHLILSITILIRLLLVSLIFDFQSGVISSTPSLLTRGLILFLPLRGIGNEGLLLPTTNSNQTCRAINCLVEVKLCIALSEYMKITANSNLSSFEMGGCMCTAGAATPVSDSVISVAVKSAGRFVSELGS